MEALWLVLLLEVIMTSSAARGPPRVVGKVSHRQSVRLGRTAKLACPVDGDPPPLMMWTKDGRHIHSGWTRFRALQHGLRIKEVETEDAGTYVCKATNGFGSVNINYTLIVIDDSSLRNGEGEPTGSSMQPPDLAGKPVRPRFTEPAKMRRRVIERPVGSSVRLKCTASGNPHPDIVWLKDSKPLAEEQDGGAGGEKKKKKKRWTLSLKNLAPEHSGKYTCHVSNRAGQINATYKVEVIQRSISKPVLTGSHPVNTTVDHGGTTSFQCKVRSDAKPVIQWLKRVEPGDEARFNSTIEAGDQRFVVLPTGEVWSRPDGSYLNKLLISRAQQDDAGMYVCLGANSKGYSFRSAYLTVLPDRKSQPSSVPTVTPPGLPWPVIIGIPAGLAFILGTALLWFYQSKRSCSGSASSAPPAAPRRDRDRDRAGPPPPPAGSDKDSLTYEEYAAAHQHQQQQLLLLPAPKLHPKVYTDLHTHTHSHVNGKVQQHIHYQR